MNEIAVITIVVVVIIVIVIIIILEASKFQHKMTATAVSLSSASTDENESVIIPYISLLNYYFFYFFIKSILGAFSGQLLNSLSDYRLDIVNHVLDRIYRRTATRYQWVLEAVKRMVD